MELPVRYIWTNEATNLSIWDGDNMRPTLYAQWQPWTDASEFDYFVTQYREIAVSGYNGTSFCPTPWSG